MKMTLKEARERYEGLSGLKTLTLPIRLGYAIGYNLEKLKPYIENADRQLDMLCEKYAAKDAEGNVIIRKKVVNGQEVSYMDISGEMRRKINKEYEEFAESEEIEIDIRMIPLSMLEECEKERYDTPNVANQSALTFMIEE